MKDPAETKNYRGIAGSILVLKLSDKVILIVWGSNSGSLQLGYKCGSSTAQCSYVMMETVNYFLKNGSNPIMVALDMSSAFEKCHFDFMFQKIEARLPAVVTSALICIYEQHYAWVRWGHTCKSEIFRISNGCLTMPLSLDSAPWTLTSR